MMHIKLLHQSKGEQIARCMNIAVDKHGSNPDLINAHATSTPMGDTIELDAINRIGLGKMYHFVQTNLN